MTNAPARIDVVPTTVVSDEDLAVYFDSDNALVREFRARADARVLNPRGSLLDYGPSFNNAAWELMLDARKRLEARAHHPQTSRVIAANATHPGVALTWITWYAVLYQEVESGLVMGDKGLSDANGYHFVASFYKGCGGRISKGDIDRYGKELLVAIPNLADKIALTVIGEAPDDRGYEPRSIGHAVGMLTKFALENTRHTLRDPNSDTMIETGQVPGPGGTAITIVPFESTNSEGDAHTKELVDPTDPPIEEKADIGQDDVVTSWRVLFEWIDDDDSYHDQSTKGMVRHLLFGFTSREKAAVKKIYSLVGEDVEILGQTKQAMDNRKEHRVDAQDLRGFATASLEISRLFYMVGGLGPQRSFSTMTALKAAVAATDRVYKGKRNNNPVLKILRAAGGRAVVLRDGYNAHVTPEELDAFLTASQAPTSDEDKESTSDEDKESRDAARVDRETFVGVGATLPIEQPTDAIAALHYCEDSWAMSLGRKKPCCVLDFRCQGHPLTSSTKKGA